MLGLFWFKCNGSRKFRYSAIDGRILFFRTLRMTGYTLFAIMGLIWLFIKILNEQSEKERFSVVVVVVGGGGGNVVVVIAFYELRQMNELFSPRFALRNLSINYLTDRYHRVEINVWNRFMLKCFVCTYQQPCQGAEALNTPTACSAEGYPHKRIVLGLTQNWTQWWDGRSGDCEAHLHSLEE